MSTDRSSSNDEQTYQSEKERWEFAHALTPNINITLNRDYTNLSITNIRPNADGGDVTEITLQNNTDNTFTLTVRNDSPSVPLLTLPNNDQIPVTSITPTDRSLLSTDTAYDIYNLQITDLNIDSSDTYPKHRSPTPTLNASDITVIGECPNCDCIVAKQDERAICTGCGTWTPIDQWEAYYETKHAPENTTNSDPDTPTQQTLTDTWPTDPDPTN